MASNPGEHLETLLVSELRLPQPNERWWLHQCQYIVHGIDARGFLLVQQLRRGLTPSRFELAPDVWRRALDDGELRPAGKPSDGDFAP